MFMRYLCILIVELINLKKKLIQISGQKTTPENLNWL